jgi:NOL1/NOP2/fmu family ribosome biogenesis protein
MVPTLNSADDSTPTGSIQWDSSWPKWLSPAERLAVLSYFSERFALPEEAFSDFLFWKTAHAYGVISRDAQVESLRSLKIHSIGMVILRKVGRYLKPTTHALQIFGPMARKNVLELEKTTLLELLEKRVISLRHSVDPGYVILTHRQDILGCGLALPDRLLHQFSQWMVSALTAALHQLS